MTYRLALLTGTLLLAFSMSACTQKRETSNISAVAISANHPASLKPSNSVYIISPNGFHKFNSTKEFYAWNLTKDKKPNTGSVTTQEPEASLAETSTTAASEDILFVRNTTISMEESKDSLVNKLGIPNRVLETEYDFDYYVYNNDYKKLLFIAVKDEQVAGFYTDSTDFTFREISSGAALTTINNTLDRNYSLKEVLDYSTDSYNIKLLMDSIGTEKLTGLYVLSKEVKEDGFSEVIMKNIELLVFDLTNSIRARNGLGVLSWSSSAAISARKHSLDMAVKNFFDHADPDGKTPGDRLREEGISFSSIGENIIAGYGTAILSTHAWFNSLGHRNNLLHTGYQCSGVGFTYQTDSNYKSYITQIFYR